MSVSNLQHIFQSIHSIFNELSMGLEDHLGDQIMEDLFIIPSLRKSKEQNNKVEL